MMFDREQIIDPMGGFKTQSLFYETNGTLHDPVMTLGVQDKEHNGKILPSLHRLYMELADPEEYEVAMLVFGSWVHWQSMFSNVRIMRYITRYREELEVKLRSEAVKALIKTAKIDGAKGTAAAKYIAENGWKKRKAGAPSKEEVKRELKTQTRIDSELKEDMDRLGLKVVK